MVTVRGRLTPEVGVLLMQALDAARDTLYQQARLQCVDGSSDAPTMAQRQADALALLAETAFTMASILAPRESDTRSSSTSMPRLSRIPINPARPSSRTACTFPRKRRAARLHCTPGLRQKN